MFLALYDHFPDTCIALVKARIFADMAYWKDCLLIWSTIMKMDGMDTRGKFAKYNPLIEAFRESIMSQRTEDLQALDTFVAPRRIRDVSKDELVQLLQAPNAMLPSLTWMESSVSVKLVRQITPVAGGFRTLPMVGSFASHMYRLCSELRSRGELDQASISHGV